MAVNAIQCLNAGQCVAMKVWQYYTAIGVFGFAGMLLVLLFLLKFWTPAFIFLKAKMKKSPIFLMVNRAQQGRFRIGKVEHEGLANIPKAGMVIMSENSHIIERQSHIPMFISHGEFAPTVTLDYAYVVQQLRESGVKMDNWDDVDRVVRGWIGKLDENALRAQLEDGTIKEDEFKQKMDFKAKLEKMNVLIRPYKTMRIHDLAYMFPFNITPAMIESQTQYKLAMKQQYWNKWLNLQTAVIIIVVLMGIALVGFIAWKLFQGGNTQAAADALSQAANAFSQAQPKVQVVQNLTG